MSSGQDQVRPAAERAARPVRRRRPVGLVVPARRADGASRRASRARRLLLAADLAALVLAFAVTQALFGAGVASAAMLVGIAPVWVVVAKIRGLYDRDEERIVHSTVDDVAPVAGTVTLGVWLGLLAAHAAPIDEPRVAGFALFWAAAIVLVVTGRVVARAASHRSGAGPERILIVGAGHVGQLVARKLMQHREYGVRLVGFVDDDPRPARAEVAGVPVRGGLRELPRVIRREGVERVVVAFSEAPVPDMLAAVRRLPELDVRVDVVPRLFDLLGPRIAYHSLEALPLVGLPRTRMSRSSRCVKRLMDVAIASALLAAVAPVWLAIAVAIRLDSPGPVLFRQRRLGGGMREFTALKFRTMRTDADQAVHREYIRRTMAGDAVLEGHGVYKLARPDAVTRVGAWLRRTSLDELPQLLNVVRGDMSLVGPRPCIPYETEFFKPHQFERFAVPAGLTGLWQVTARAHSSFGEALDMDVAYVHGWSLALDLRLLVQTPLQMLRKRGTA